MRKYLLLLLIFSCSKLRAQNNTPAFSGGFELAAPSRSAYKIGFGGSIKLEVPITTPLDLTLTGGFTALAFKSDLLNSSDKHVAARFVPLKAGVRYFASPGLYAEGELGVAIETNYTKQNSFAFSIGPGFMFPLDAKDQIDLGFRYEHWANQLTQTGIRIAYRFGL